MTKDTDNTLTGLMDERIHEIATSTAYEVEESKTGPRYKFGALTIIDFAKAIEREVRADVERLLAEKEAAPAGWKLVPVEPTDEMRCSVKHQAYSDLIDEDWAAMLAAAPLPPAPAQEEVASIRDQALEEAARICDDRHYNWRFGDGDDSVSGPKECAAIIRALKTTKEQA